MQTAFFNNRWEESLTLLEIEEVVSIFHIKHFFISVKIGSIAFIVS